MRRVLWIVGAVAAVGLAVALWLSMAGGPVSGGNVLGGGGNGSDGAGPGAAPTPSAAGASSEATDPSETAPTQGPLPGAAPESGSEVPTPGPATPTSGGLPPVPAPTPLVGSPLPKTAAATGSLVEGYPEDVMGPTDGADVVSSAIATEGSHMQVTLVARTDAPPEEVRAHYRALWASLGLSDAGGTAAAGAAYADQLSSLTLAFSTASGTGTLYTVTGVFRSS
jgi:hypothetical protein